MYLLYHNVRLTFDAFIQVSSDNLYKLDLKLREIKADIRTGDGAKPFGNVAVIFLGDIMQLKLVRGEGYFS